MYIPQRLIYQCLTRHFFFQNFPILFEQTRIHFRMFTNYYDAYVTPSYTILSSLRPYHHQSQLFVIFFTLCELRSAHYKWLQLYLMQPFCFVFLQATISILLLRPFNSGCLMMNFLHRVLPTQQPVNAPIDIIIKYVKQIFIGHQCSCRQIKMTPSQAERHCSFKIL